MSLTKSLPQPPTNARPLTRSAVLPLFGWHRALLLSRALIPILAITAVGVWAWEMMDNWQTAADAMPFFHAIAAALLVAIFYLVYLYAGETESSLRYWLVGLVTYGQCKLLFWQVYDPVFRHWLATSPYRFRGGFLATTWNDFIAAGLCEELLKALPILPCLALALLRKRDGSLLDWFALRGPLDGMMMGVASAILFTMWETSELFVPNQIDGAYNLTAGYLAAMKQMVPRILDSFAGHVGYSGIVGYAIGLSATHPRYAPRLLLGGWVVASALHGLWDALGTVSQPYFMLATGLVTATLFLAFLQKARQLEAPRLAAEGSLSILIRRDDPAQSLVGGAVPPDLPGPQGALARVASVVERSIGLETRTTEPIALPRSGLAIGTPRARYALAADRVIDFSRLFAKDGMTPGFAGRVDGTSGGSVTLRNTGSTPWTITTPAGILAQIAPGGDVEPVRGMRLRLGATWIDVVAFGP